MPPRHAAPRPPHPSFYNVAPIAAIAPIAPIAPLAPITPNSNLTVTLKQAAVGVGAILIAGSGWAYMVSNQLAQGKDISEIKTTVAAVTTANVAATKEQDAKREAMGRDFLNAQKDIAKSIGDLAIQQATQQHDMKSATDALARLSEQLGSVTQTAPASLRRR